MFKNIMVPVDLAHAKDQARALKCAGDLARQYGGAITFVGVTSSAPSSTAHNPQEFQAKLSEFAEAQAGAQGVTATAHAVISHDPTTDLDDALLRAAKDLQADLVVMASHLPNLTDYIWPSNGGKVAAHADASVLVVRG